MKEQLKGFYNDVVSKPAYWLPILVFTVVAFGYSLFNCSISTDDLWPLLNRESSWFQTSRWGMTVWSYLAGIYMFTPFVDEFIALLYLIGSSVGLSFIFYLIGKSKDVYGYLILSSIFVTFPLINEIWCYNGANFYYTGGLLLGIITIVVLNSPLNRLCKYTLSSVLMVLPAASYEAPIFSYITLVCVVIFYKYVVIKKQQIKVRRLFEILFKYAIPLIVALCIKFAVPFIHNIIYDTPYYSLGQTGIYWLESNPIYVFAAIIRSIGFHYILSALIYLPLTEFLICILVVFFFMTRFSLKQKSFFPFLWGCLVVLSIFSQSLLQGCGLPHRSAQGISVFVAFVLFLFYQEVSTNSHSVIKRGVIIMFLFLCWHQSVYIHKINALNILRSENESAMVHDVGNRLISDYDRKPVVFVSEYSRGKWVNERIHVDKESWNGKLFFEILGKFVPSYNTGEPVKIIETNVNPFISAHEVRTPLLLFKYYGYDFDIVTSTATIKRAVKIAKKQNMRPYQIFDYGPFIIVQLGAEKYFCDEIEQ